jgi:hypothetical protein
MEQKVSRFRAWGFVALLNAIGITTYLEAHAAHNAFFWRTASVVCGFSAVAQVAYAAKELGIFSEAIALVADLHWSKKKPKKK